MNLFTKHRPKNILTVTSKVGGQIRIWAQHKDTAIFKTETNKESKCWLGTVQHSVITPMEKRIGTKIDTHICINQSLFAIYT